MNPTRVTEMLSELRMLPMFPGDETMLVGLTRLVGQMAHSEDQVRWLVDRMLSWNKWLGPKEMRKVFISKFKPKDGIVYSRCSCGAEECTSEVQYTLGPADVWPKQLATPVSPVKLLEGGRSEVLIDSPKIAAAISAAAKKMPKMPSARPVGADRFAERLAEVATAPQDRTQLPPPTPQTITPEQIAQAARELQERRARGERMPWE